MRPREHAALNGLPPSDGVAWRTVVAGRSAVLGGCGCLFCCAGCRLTGPPGEGEQETVRKRSKLPETAANCLQR
eukprot:1921633-Alexandrium_andersonii.AAC.1